MKSSFCKGKALFQCKLCLLCEIFTGGGRTAQCSSEDIDDFFGRIESFFYCFYQTVFEDAGCFFGFVLMEKNIMSYPFLFGRTIVDGNSGKHFSLCEKNFI